MNKWTGICSYVGRAARSRRLCIGGQRVGGAVWGRASCGVLGHGSSGLACFVCVKRGPSKTGCLVSSKAGQGTRRPGVSGVGRLRRRGC